MPKPEGPGHTHDHGDMPAQNEGTLHEDGHTHIRDVTANGEHPHDAKPGGKTPAMDGAGAAHKKAGHTHAPGTPPHKD